MQAGMIKGNPWLRGMLGEVVWAISHTRDNYLVEQYRRIARRRGKHKAIVAVAHSVLVIIYHVLRDQRPYTDLGRIILINSTKRGWSGNTSVASNS